MRFPVFRNTSIVLSIATLLSLTANPAKAQVYSANDSSSAGAVALRGSINHTDYKEENTRLKRITPQSAFSDDDARYQGYLNEPGQFRLTRQDAKLATKNSSEPLTGLVDTNSLKGKVKEAPYIWEQSRYGGYYDRTGIIKEVIPGQELSRYGGKFADGSPVMDWVNTNGANHVFWQPGLGHHSFKRMR